MTDLDFYLALSSTRVYGTRCFPVHGKSYNLFMSRKYAELAEYMDAENNLSEEKKPVAGQYERIIPIAKDHRIGNGK